MTAYLAAAYRYQQMLDDEAYAETENETETEENENDTD